MKGYAIHEDYRINALQWPLLPFPHYRKNLVRSENCLWRIQRRMKKGEAVEFYGMYGYDYQKGNITINESQAAVVRQMFEWYIGGRGMSAIAKRLNEQGVTAYLGGRWTPSRMGDLLANEKLTGNSMLQKFYSTDHLTKQQKRDNGEKPRYFVEGTHGSQ